MTGGNIKYILKVAQKAVILELVEWLNYLILLTSLTHLGQVKILQALVIVVFQSNVA